MRNILLTFMATLFISSGLIGQDSKIHKAHEIYWLGIDYNHCYFITSYDFKNPVGVEKLLKAWNVLIYNEKEKYIDKALKYKQVTIASSFISSLNENADVKEHIVDDLSREHHLKSEDIQGIVNGYNFPEDLTGVGLILIAESYSKPAEMGSYYATFFDIKTGKILATERMTGKAGGFGLRNYWAKTYYLVLKQIGKKY